MPGVTIRDVAREAGVSIATVSYVLNNSRRVGEESRRRVLDAVKRLGYRPNIIARSLQASETRLFGFSWPAAPPDQFNPIFDRFLVALGSAAALQGYRILTFPANGIADEVAIYEELILIGQVDGFVLSNTDADDLRVQSLLEMGFPFVAFGRSNPDWDFPWVDVDGRAGVKRAVEHLIERGHCRIACLAWSAGSLTGEYRLAGYEEAMSQTRIGADATWIERCANNHDEAYAAAGRLLALPTDRRPSAIIAMSDLMAMGAMNAIWDAGLCVGRDVAVVGFDDAPVARFLRPPLTSLSQPIGEIGDSLVRMLVDLCKGRPIAEPHVLMEPELMVRGSSALRYDFRE